MKIKTWQQIEAILDQVFDLEEPERTRYIEEHIDDEELRAEVRSLLHAELHVPRYLDSGLDQLFGIIPRHIHHLTRQIPSGNIEIDRYKIIKEIGRGGMSVVYLAERTDGEFDQQAAVKIIHPFGLDREDRFRRLKAERQILANLQHPNIARVFDGGMTPEGWPYMVMEFVEGIPVTTYCREKNPDLNARLELFQKVCEAVTYAHRNLVVHRDLKPGNILVTDSGEVKLLDFGIAKLLEEDTHAAQLTRTGLPLMTPEYAAPEQFRGETVTTSVDVYSLGVLLYELLAGVRPYDLSGKSISEMEQLVCDEEPDRPSGKSPSNDLKGDLDLICMKALRKEPGQRYTSVQELKEDLVRYQQGLPVQARPASIGYKARKFIKRNKAALLAAAFFLITIIGFAIYHIYQVTEQRNIAQAEAEKATRIKNFTTDLFHSGNPYASSNVDEGMTLKQVLDNGLRNIENELADDPEVYAEMQHVVGHALMGVGDYEQSRASLENSLEKAVEFHGENHASVASTMSLLGRLEGIRGNFDTAVTRLEKALTIHQTLEGEVSSSVAINYAETGRIYALKRDYEKASEYFIKGLNIHEELGEKDKLDYALTLSELVNVQIRQGLFEEAENNQMEAIENIRRLRGEQHLSMADSYIRLAEIYYYKSNPEESKNYALKAFELQETLLGPGHPGIMNALSFLGHLSQRQGEYEESEKYHRQTVRLFFENELTDSLKLSSYLNNLAVTKSSMGQLDSAAVYHNDVLRIRKQLLPPDHSSITLSMYNMADVYYKMNHLDRAAALFEQVVERDKHSLGEDHREVAVDLVKLAAVYRDLKEYQRAEEAFQEAGLIFVEKFPEHHYRTGEYYKEYGVLKIMQEQNDQAFEFLTKSLAIFRENYAEDHTNVKSVEEYLTALSQKNKPD